jgi:hypothetical protein
MSNTPYVTGQNQQKNTSTYGSGGTTGAIYTSNVYGAPSVATTSNYATVGSTTSPATTSSYNPYQNISTGNTMSTMINSNNPYGAVPSAPVTKNNNPYENMPTVASSPYGASTVPSATSFSPSSTLPNFSKTSDVSPPGNPVSYGYTNFVSPNKCDSSAVVATAYRVTDAGHAPGKPGMSLVNSMTYQGGPTNGLVSEGNPVKCHKVDYEIKGHEMQLVEYVLKST